jgi:hypothetical protein
LNDGSENWCSGRWPWAQWDGKCRSTGASQRGHGDDEGDAVAPKRGLYSRASSTVAAKSNDEVYASAMQHSQIPASIKSVYRIFLRACASAVLHHPAKHTLRRLWRANFDEAVSVHRQYAQADLAAHERAKRAEWLRVWESRGAHAIRPYVAGVANPGRA